MKISNPEKGKLGAEKGIVKTGIPGFDQLLTVEVY